MKLHFSVSNLTLLLCFWNLVSKSLAIVSIVSLSLSPKGTSHRFLAVKEWRLLWNMTVVLIAQSTATAGRLKESTVCYGQECDVEEWASVNVSQGLSLSGSLHNLSWWMRKSIWRAWLGKGGQGEGGAGKGRPKDLRYPIMGQRTDNLRITNRGHSVITTKKKKTAPAIREAWNWNLNVFM